jgi:hypothetical protein
VDSIIKILNDIDSQKLSVADGLIAINSISPEVKKQKRARKMKISVVDEGKRVRIPAMPFWFLSIFCKFSLKYGNKKLNKSFKEDIFDSDEDAEFLKSSCDINLDNITSADIDLFLKELRNFGSFTFVDVYDGEDNTSVKIDLI